MKQWLLGLLKGLGKRAVIKLLENYGDALQEDVKRNVQSKGPVAIDRYCDEWQSKIEAGIGKVSFLPDALRDRLIALVQEHGDDLQESLKKALLKGGPDALDRVFDAAQALLVARIQAL